MIKIISTATFLLFLTSLYGCQKDETIVTDTTVKEQSDKKEEKIEIDKNIINYWVLTKINDSLIKENETDIYIFCKNGTYIRTDNHLNYTVGQWKYDSNGVLYKNLEESMFSFGTPTRFGIIEVRKLTKGVLEIYEQGREGGFRYHYEPLSDY